MLALGWRYGVRSDERALIESLLVGVILSSVEFERYMGEGVERGEVGGFMSHP